MTEQAQTTEEKAPHTPEQIHQSNKNLRQHLAFAHYVLKNRTQFMHEEFIQAAQTIEVLQSICMDLQAKIEAVEPPMKTENVEPRKPYVIEAPTATESVQ